MVIPLLDISKGCLKTRSGCFVSWKYYCSDKTFFFFFFVVVVVVLAVFVCLFYLSFKFVSSMFKAGAMAGVKYLLLISRSVSS